MMSPFPPQLKEKFIKSARVDHPDQTEEQLGREVDELFGLIYRQNDAVLNGNPDVQWTDKERARLDLLSAKFRLNP